MGKNRIDRCLRLPAQTIQDVGHAISDTLSLVTATALSILLLGTNKEVNRQTNQTHTSARILSFTYRRLIKTINPQTPFSNKARVYEGFFTGKIKAILTGYTNSFSRAENPIKKLVYSRCSHASSIILALITRSFDLILATGAIPIALTKNIFCFSNQTSAMKTNEFIFENLQFFSVIEDVSDGLRGIINPQQFNEKFIFF